MYIVHCPALGGIKQTRYEQYRCVNLKVALEIARKKDDARIQRMDDGIPNCYKFRNGHYLGCIKGERDYDGKLP